MSDRTDETNRPASQDRGRESLDGGPDLDTVKREPVADGEDAEAQNPRTADERSGKPFPTTPPDPTGDDPHMAGALRDAEGDEIEEGSGELAEPQPQGDGPIYERDQGPGDDRTGGSSDPANTRSHADQSS